MSVENKEQQEQDLENTEPKKGLLERFTSIEEVLDRMEDADVTLEESFALYKRGISELAAADAMLDEIEKAMLVMTEDGNLEEF